MKKGRILVVDDDRNVTGVVSIGLRRMGCVVRTENESYAAMDAARQFKPDVILLDVVMPHIDGADLAQQFKSNPGTADIPVIFLSSIIQKHEVRENAGVIAGDEFIAKPAGVAEIAERIRARLRKREDLTAGGVNNER